MLWYCQKRNSMFCFLKGNLDFLGICQHSPLDWDQNSGSIMAFVREDITAKFLSFEDQLIEALYIELNFRKKKWLLSGSYNPNKNNIPNNLQRLRKNLGLYSAKYDNIILPGDSNVSPAEPHMETFCESYG